MTTLPKTVPFRDHLSVSEIVFGLILSGRQTPTGFSPEKFGGEYGKMLKDFQEGMSEADLIVKYGTTLVQAARHAARSINGLGENLDWREVIHISYTRETIAEGLQAALKHIERGDMDRFNEILQKITATHAFSQKLKSVRASEISSEYTPMIESGSRAIDNHIGGLPSVGLFVLGAKTFTGKTTVAISLMDNYLRRYPDREALFVTIEDMNEGWKHRAEAILGNRPRSFWDRIHVMEFASSPEEVLNEASRFADIGIIIVDFIDLMAKENDLASFEEIYRKFSLGSKMLAANNKWRNMPIILLAQFGKTLYAGGVPTPNVLKYTGEDKAYHICLLYHAYGDFYADNDSNPYYLPSDKGYAYLVYWKVKNARPHGEDFPGAIKVPWSARTGYDLSAEGEWYSLAPETRREIPKQKRR